MPAIVMHDMQFRHKPCLPSGLLIRRAAMMITISFITACGAPAPRDPGSIAKTLAAEFLSVPVTDTTLVSVSAQEFNDSSLDCPEPGMSYLQVLTPGYRVIVEADGRRFDVRVSGNFGRICRRKKSAAPASQSAR
jgi:hypothetical protein